MDDRMTRLIDLAAEVHGCNRVEIIVSLGVSVAGIERRTGKLPSVTLEEVPEAQVLNGAREGRDGAGILAVPLRLRAARQLERDQRAVEDAARALAAELDAKAPEDYQLGDDPEDDQRYGAFEALLEFAEKIVADPPKTELRDFGDLTAILARHDRAVAVARCARIEREARAKWLALLPAGSCASPPPQELLDAEALTGEALHALDESRDATTRLTTERDEAFAAEAPHG